MLKYIGGEKKMKEYDIVELIGMKPKYEKYGLKIGDVG